MQHGMLFGGAIMLVAIGLLVSVVQANQPLVAADFNHLTSCQKQTLASLYKSKPSNYLLTQYDLAKASDFCNQEAAHKAQTAELRLGQP